MVWGLGVLERKPRRARLWREWPIERLRFEGSTRIAAMIPREEEG